MIIDAGFVYTKNNWFLESISISEFKDGTKRSNFCAEKISEDEIAPLNVKEISMDGCSRTLVSRLVSKGWPLGLIFSESKRRETNYVFCFEIVGESVSPGSRFAIGNPFDRSRQIYSWHNFQVRITWTFHNVVISPCSRQSQQQYTGFGGEERRPARCLRHTIVVR